ncbi:PepSY-associated TM helix domain-containing protein [Sphingomonas sp.]|uniref:PepSY-associated TM helix domain-containing protein n=1 Tax=Sphingomonas sp. TaxID=28214 RepID=UPI002E36A048|nr:PepSY-associated TM helix domain-containing protein [Sphingomonas sp.]HEX4695490.1 PepSY-associated TM helix domain-containing protein [Sphingomonas sp.]
MHKWIGLALAILIIPLCVTGAALVWDQALDHAINPQRYATTAGPMLAPDRLAASAQAAIGPGDRLATLKMPTEPGDPAVAASGAKPTSVQGPSPRANVYLDPATGRVLDVSNSRSGLIMVVHQLHGTLLVPVWGRSIIGWIGVAMLVSCFTGIRLWWPAVGSWVRGLRWRRHRNLDTNLHHLFGFWIAVPLFVLSLTGAWISFPSFFGPLVRENGRAMGFSAERAALNKAQPLAATATSLAVAQARALAVIPGQITQVTWPNDYRAAWQFAIKPPKGMPATVAVDDSSGRGSIVADVDRGQAGIARSMRRIHDGTDMGIVWQIVIFLGGLLPVGLAATGVMMWWRTRRWRAELDGHKQRKLAD